MKRPSRATRTGNPTGGESLGRFPGFWREIAPCDPHFTGSQSGLCLFGQRHAVPDIVHILVMKESDLNGESPETSLIWIRHPRKVSLRVSTRSVRRPSGLLLVANRTSEFQSGCYFQCTVS